MQVNNCTEPKPSFGMALRINPKAGRQLKEQPLKIAQKLEQAGAILGREGEDKATKFYHVDVDENLNAKLTANQDAYFGLFNTKEYTTRNGMRREAGKDVTADNIVMIHPTSYKTQLADVGVARYVPHNSKQPFFNVWDVTGLMDKLDNVDELAKVAKVLDSVAAQKAYEKAAQNTLDTTKKIKVGNIVDNLIDKYGMKRL